MKCMFIGLCHDLAESVVGDIPTYAGVPKEEKHKRESLAFRFIADLVKPCNAAFADEITSAWLDYEEGRTEEGRWMKEMDKLECLIQAHEYEQATFAEKDLEEFQGLTSKISSTDGTAWLELLRGERSAHMSKRLHRLPIVFVTGREDMLEKHYARLCAELGFKHISLSDVLHDFSRRQNDLHTQFVRDCLRENIEVPAVLVVSLLEKKIQEVSTEEKEWVLVSGFPSSKEQLLEFERKNQYRNYTVLLSQPHAWVLREGGVMGFCC
ncbi:unnamed protein product [Zymoseptoria tritici ST99CH_1A5]|nr:unnamed protein product [Zymoseptoria tritici ST99CH_1A5]